MKVYIATQAKASFDGSCHAVVDNVVCATKDGAVQAIHQMIEDYFSEYYDGYDDDEVKEYIAEAKENYTFHNYDDSHIEWFYELQEVGK